MNLCACNRTKIGLDLFGFPGLLNSVGITIVIYNGLMMLLISLQRHYMLLAIVVSPA